LDLFDLAQGVSQIAVHAGEKIMEVYRDPDTFEIELKKDSSPLTLADRRANDLICSELEVLQEGIPIVSEENREIPYSVRNTYKTFWLVDPLDGTKEFVNRNGEFTVNIALVDDQIPVLGVIHIPNKGETYFAVRGRGAFRSESMDRLQCDPFKAQDAMLRIACSRSHLDDDTKEYLSRYKDPVLIPRGSALKFLIIATGDADIYPRLGPTMEWDTGAAQIILEESGGSVLTYPWFKPLKYNKSSLRNPSFIACGNGALLP
jgi:3'(2'), 5'-bisphosphate nucleotidase